MRKKEAIILFLLLNISLVFATELNIEPETISSQPGEIFSINIMLQNNENIFGIDFQLNKINGLELLNYSFLNRTKNSMTNVVEQEEFIRFGIIFSANTTGITIGNERIIKLNYNSTQILNEELLFSKIFLSDKKGQEIQTNTTGTNIIIKERNADLTCVGTEGAKDDKIIIKIYAEPEEVDIGGLDFYQNFNNEITYISTSKTTATNNALIVVNPETEKIRIAMAGVNITEKTHILDITYEINNPQQSTVELDFSDITISNTKGELISLSQSNICSIKINEKTEITIPSSGSSRGGGGGINKVKENTEEKTKQISTNLLDSYTSLLNKNPEENKEKKTEPVFFTQEKPAEIEENIKSEEQEETKKSKKSIPFAIITLTALIGLAVVVVFELKK